MMTISTFRGINQGAEMDFSVRAQFGAVGALVLLASMNVAAQTANTKTTYSYDALNRVTQVTDPSGFNTTYQYDGLSDPTSTTSPDSGTKASTFDAAGNVLTATDANGNTVTYTYDAANRRLMGTYADSTQNVTYAYDQSNSITGCSVSYPVGHLTQVVENSVTTTFCYNAQGYVIQKTQALNGQNQITSYTRTPGGRLLAITHPSGNQINYSRDGDGNISGVSVTTNSGTTTIVSNVTYEPFGPVVSYTLGSGQTITRSYDANYRMTDLTSPAFVLHFARDQMGDVSAIGNSPGANPATESYSYDPLYRLTTVTEANGSVYESATYNQAGDRLTKTGAGLATGNYSYNPGTHQLSATGNEARAVDANGNTTAITEATGTYGFGFNARNRMALVQLNQSTIANYLYNDDGERIEKTVGGSTETYNYDLDSHLIGEYGTTNREYVYMDDVPVANLDISGTTTTIAYVTADDQGTPRAITDASGNQLWAWPYEGNPWGELSPITNGYTYNLRLPGQYFDVESGLSNNLFRDFDSSSGRYTETDPIGRAGGLALYVYGKNNPLSYIDPTGLQARPAPTPPPGTPPSLEPAPGTVTVPNPGGAANDPDVDPEAPGAGAAVEACAGAPIVCGIIMAVIPRDAGGPEDENPDNVVPFPLRRRYNPLECPEEDNKTKQQEYCEELRASVRRTCESLKGKKRMQCFQAANDTYDDCMAGQ
jgi:RHS repeat-associated protein